MNTTALCERLKAMDVLGDTVAKFDAFRKRHDLVAAVAHYTDDLIIARALTRIVRPLITDYGTVSEEMWLSMVREARDDATRQLIGVRLWRSNSTSVLQNAVNQWEAEALARFVDDLRYFKLDF